MDVLDPESDSVRTCTYVEEAEELNDLVQKAVDSGGQDAGTLLARFNAIVSPWLTSTTALSWTTDHLIKVHATAACEVPRTGKPPGSSS